MDRLGKAIAVATSSIIAGTVTAISSHHDSEQVQQPVQTIVVTTTTTEPITTTTVFVYRELSEGMHGEDVRRVQQKLKDIGYHIIIDGDYGPKTREVVKKFQLEHGLYMDGIVGPQTYAALGIVAEVSHGA